MLSSLATLAFVGLAAALPSIKRDTTVSVVPAATEDALTIYAQFSRAAYCGVTTSWTCGAACDALPGVEIVLAGGDGDSIPMYFVGYWPTEKTAVVVHEGTDPTQFLSDLTDAEFFLESLDTTLFPGVDSGVQVHDGFGKAQASTATAILAAVETVFSKYSTSTVTIVGHSLGAAIGTIDGIYLKLHLPSSTTFKHVLHGSPRVGNQAFADYIDAHFTDFTRINHTEDPIPIVPGRALGFHHASGEDHINDDGTWYACEGQDNTSTDCSTGDVPNIIESDIIDHLGPYNGIWLGTTFCS